MPRPDVDPQAWERFAVKYRGTWNNLITRHILGRVHIPDSHSDMPRSGEVMDVPCPNCLQSFPSTAAMLSHCARQHGYRHPARCRIQTNHCLCCMIMHWSRERMLYHLKKSKVCMWYYMEHVAPLDADIVAELDTAAAAVQADNLRRGLQPRHAATPCTRLAGPLCREASEALLSAKECS